MEAYSSHYSQHRTGQKEQWAVKRGNILGDQSHPRREGAYALLKNFLDIELPHFTWQMCLLSDLSLEHLSGWEQIAICGLRLLSEDVSLIIRALKGHSVPHERQ